MFESTEEPVTVNKNREKEEKERQTKYRAEREEELKRKRIQAVNDSLDSYYNPSGFRKKQEVRARRVRAISEIFTQGIPYDD